MIINSTPQNEAVLSNVGQIGEFRIRNSAKAFSILSSGLYANKIRAIIRELSCNAVDSHIAAGKRDTAFDVHLPTSFEPWFAIRDYGTGLTHDQVTNIYTTYFESTKTDSNDYIGALGLGSKSPFSYTDNFTVTAIKDGKKGIYTAFINESGVPSIAKMMEEASTDPSGVEVKFSVNDRYDFNKFYQEAKEVYIHFALRPVVSADRGWEFTDLTYSSKDIIPGVHSYGSNGRVSSKAVMGNIAYPIDVPNATQNLGDLQHLLQCGLELHFNIGELDFQASREGLSYIPSTIASIKAKLELLSANLAGKLALEADKIDNLWERSIFLDLKRSENLWVSSVAKYVLDTNFPMLSYNPKISTHMSFRVFSVLEADLTAKFNISIAAFTKSGINTVMTNKSATVQHVRNAAGGYDVTGHLWEITVGRNVHFVCNDTKIGATVRTKYHWRNDTSLDNRSAYHSVYILSAVDAKKTVDFAGFLKFLENPPANRVRKASTLIKKPRASTTAAGTPVTLLKLCARAGSNRHRYYDKVWRDAGDITALDTATLHYYMPIVGFTPITKNDAVFDMKDLVENMQKSNVPGLTKDTIYGVRKTDLATVQKMKNWINLEDHIIEKLGKIDDKFWKGILKSELDRFDFLRYNSSIVKHIIKKDSLFTTVYAHLGNVDRITYNEYSLNYLIRLYNKSVVNPVSTMKTKFVNECGAVYDKYPLLKHLTSNNNLPAIAEYINLIDSKK